MQIHVNTDRNIEGHEALGIRVRSMMESALSRTSDHITRVEVHLSDQNGRKAGQKDKRCLMEARLKGRKPIAVTHEASTIDQAMDGAVSKLAKMIENTLGRLQDMKYGSH